MNEKKITLWIDLFFCCVFLPLIIALVPVDRWIEKYPYFAIMLIILLYCIYGLMRIVNIPRAIMRRKYAVVISIIGIISIATYLLSHFPFPADLPPISEQHPHLRARLRIQTVLFMALVVCGYSLSISLLLELIRQIIVKRDIELQRDKAQLSLYKAQINPHFMFNTINTLYGLTISKSDNAEEALVNFIEMLKYTYTQVDTDMIPITDEIKYLNDYIELQQLRLNNHTVVRWNYSIDDEAALVPPMLLITFVENAFKYGCSSTRDCEIRIEAQLKEKMLYFSVINNIMKIRKEEDSSIGINNCRTRLDLIYPDKHSLKIDENNGVFNVSLTIEL